MPTPRVRSLSCLLDASDDDLTVGTPMRRSQSLWSRRKGDGEITVAALTGLSVVGLVLGFVLPASDELHGPYRRISAVIGWTYFCR